MEELLESHARTPMPLRISIVAIVLLFVIQYEGWAKPLIILATVPLA